MATSRVFPSRGWWAALGVILLVAGVLRLTGYNFSLPYIDHPDEPIFYLTGREWRGLFSVDNYLAGYPPLYIWLNIGAQWGLEAVGVQGAAPTIQVLRLVSIGFNLLTLALIVYTARMGGGWIAGIVGGAAWAFAPLVIENGVYASPDPLVYLLVIAALAFALAALTHPKRAHWCVWSVAAGCLAILTKYFVVSALLPGILVAILIFWRDRRRGVGLLGAQLVLMIVTALISAAGIAVLGREGATARTQGLTNIFDLSRVINNLYHAILPINPPLFVIALAGGMAAYGLARKEQRVRADVILLSALILISVPWLAAVFSRVSETERMKDVLPATTAACVLLGLGLAQIGMVLPRWSRALVVIVPALMVFVPQIITDYRMAQQRELPDSRVALRQWADVNLTVGTVLVGAENHKTFNPFWGGIEGRQWFDWIEIEDVTQKQPDQWRTENGASYVALEGTARDQLEGNPEGAAYLAQMLPLRDFDASGAGQRGPDVTLYRLWGIEHPTSAAFQDGITLVGYDLEGEPAAPGSSITLTFYWQAAETPQDNYSLFIHLLPQDGDLIAQADGAPARPERPTLNWTDASETLISLPFTLAIPADAPPGEYDIRIGLYNYETGIRLPLAEDGADSYPLTSIVVR